jgi:hypothetical protein
MKFRFASVLLMSGLLTLPVFADTFVMKDGSKLSGTILRQDAKTYLIEVKFAKGIKDERVIAKDDVTSVVKEKPDLAAYAAIADLFPTPDGLVATQYAQRIRAVEKFLLENRGSSKTKEAKEMLAALKAEVNQILTGAVKLDGKIISAAEYRANLCEIDARIQASNIKRLAEDARYLDALREFNQFESDFRNTSIYDELLPLIKRVITVYTGDVAQSLSTFDERIKQRTDGLDRMPLSSRNATAGEIKAEETLLTNRFQTEKDAKIGWVTPHRFCKPALVETLTFGKTELARLNTMKKTPGVDAGKSYSEALALIQGTGNQVEVTAAIAAAKAAAVPQRYMDNLQTLAKAKGLKP